jgi:outer membrane lipoprotein-sorting protein
MNKLEAFTVIMFLASVILTGPLNVRAADNGLLLKRIQANFSSVHSVSCRFLQKTESQLLVKAQESSGLFYYSHPDSFCWEFTSPFKSGFALKGKSGVKWMDSRTRSVSFRLEDNPSVSAIFGQIKLLCSFRLDQIEKQYYVKVLSHDPVRIALEPLEAQGDKNIEKIIINIAADLYSIAGLELHNTDKSSTYIRFLDVQINKPIAPHIFN